VRPTYALPKWHSSHKKHASTLEIHIAEEHSHERTAEMKGSPIRAVRQILQKLPPVASHFWLIILLLIVAAFHIVTVRQGHIWGDDFAMYVHHAKNIVEGRPYTATGYLFHPSISVSPRMYPPVFPLFLAPVIRLFGLNLLAMKIEQVIFFVLVLAVVSLYWRRDLGPECTLALVAILGFSPHFWAAKDNVLSDLLFLFYYCSTSQPFSCNACRAAKASGAGRFSSVSLCISPLERALPALP
jgi:hypothetical protein